DWHTLLSAGGVGRDGSRGAEVLAERASARYQYPPAAIRQAATAPMATVARAPRGMPFREADQDRCRGKHQHESGPGEPACAHEPCPPVTVGGHAHPARAAVLPASSAGSESLPADTPAKYGSPATAASGGACRMSNS